MVPNEVSLDGNEKREKILILIFIGGFCCFTRRLGKWNCRNNLGKLC